MTCDLLKVLKYSLTNVC